MDSQQNPLPDHTDPRTVPKYSEAEVQAIVEQTRNELIARIAQVPQHQAPSQPQPQGRRRRNAAQSQPQQQVLSDRQDNIVGQVASGLLQGVIGGLVIILAMLIATNIAIGVRALVDGATAAGQAPLTVEQMAQQYGPGSIGIPIMFIIVFGIILAPTITSLLRRRWLEAGLFAVGLIGIMLTYSTTIGGKYLFPNAIAMFPFLNANPFSLFGYA